MDITIKCPECGKILLIKNQNNIETLSKKYVTCPVCKTRNQFENFEKVTKREDDERTITGKVPGSNNEDATILPSSSTSIGKLLNLQSKSEYQLKIGKNTLGRKVSNPLPTVSIAVEEMQTNNSMSREHAIIEVSRMGNGSCRHILYNWKNKNGTYINGTSLEGKDSAVLNDGDLLRFGQVVMKFELPQDDETTGCFYETRHQSNDPESTIYEKK